MSKSIKIILSYVISLALTFAIIIGISETYVTIHQWVQPDSGISTKDVSKTIGVIITIILFTHLLAREIRANPDVVSIGATNIPNFMYHPDFTKQVQVHSDVIKENKELENELKNQEEYNERLLDELERKDFDL